MTATRERFDVEAERRTLGAMTAGELRRRYHEVGGDEARSRNREYLIRRILWMLQAGERGGYHPGMSPFASADLDSILGAIRAEISTLRGMGVMRIGVFGSRARGAGRLDSDVDVLVEFEPHRDLLDLVAVKQHLESVLGLPVDVTTPSGLRDCDRPAILQDLRYAA